MQVKVQLDMYAPWWERKDRSIPRSLAKIDILYYYTFADQCSILADDKYYKDLQIIDNIMARIIFCFAAVEILIISLLQ